MIEPDITRLSPNVNPSPMPTSCKTVIIHCTRSGKSMNPTEFEGTLNYMATPGTTSSHWVVARAGLKARVVADNQQAWHAAEDNDNAWGIELEQGAEIDGFTEAQIGSLVDICRGYVEDFGVPIRHATNSTEGGFIGHQETAQGKRDGKSDPGVLFPWDTFFSMLQGQPPVTPTTDQEQRDALETLAYWIRRDWDVNTMTEREKQAARDAVARIP